MGSSVCVLAARRYITSRKCLRCFIGEVYHDRLRIYFPLSSKTHSTVSIAYIYMSDIKKDHKIQVLLFVFMESK